MVRKLTIFLVFSLAVLAAAQTRNNTPTRGTSATAQALISIENKWVEALQKADTATLDSIFADTFVDTDEQGHRSNKQDVFSALKSGDLKLESVKLSDMQVYQYGGAAVVTGIGVQTGNFKGHPLAAKIAFTDTFIRQNRIWRAVASHRSPA